ncbi:helix-turn-helix transcriptional regulator [Amycolatopsis sp. NPDC049868]|uniref:helix-turn-helix transcriptional regulator n=1 Tax=Amycolatopsis sp. NPDC049868 TaxID=3363934 RepID=UPI0037966BBE
MAVVLTLPRHALFETTDYDQAGEYLTGVHGTSFRLSGGRDGYCFRHNRMATDAFSITTSTLTDDIAFTVESMPTLLIARPRTVTVDFRSAGTEQRFGPGEVFLAAKTEHGPPFWTRWRGGSNQAVVLPFSQLDKVAATGDARRPAPIRFTDLCPRTLVAAQHLASTIDYLTDALNDRPDSMSEPLVVGTAGQLLAATVLSVFPNTALTEPTIEDRHDAHPATLRRAIAFIDDHAQLDISVAEIAAAAHVTIRALQYAFRRHRGTTPMGYLRHARLQHAHQELLAADPGSGVTVTEIAARWGFFHPGRFAHHYRNVYGCPPYRTLLRDT